MKELDRVQWESSFPYVLLSCTHHAETSRTGSGIRGTTRPDADAHRPTHGRACFNDMITIEWISKGK